MNKRLRQTAIWVGILSMLAVGGYWLCLLYGLLFPPNTEPKRTDFQTVRFILPQDPFTQFRVKSVREANATLKPSDLVLGVTIDQESRAYPIDMLNENPDRKIINDTLGGQAIAATW